MQKSRENDNENVLRAWNANVVFWDECMGEGNDFSTC